MSRKLLIIGLLLVIAVPLHAQTVVFRDDFNGPGLAPGWSFVREVPSKHTLSDRQGYFRIYTQRGGIDETNPANNLLLRPISGDFILETRLEFNPYTAAQFAGIIIYLDDNRGVFFGLSYAMGERGTFRGIALVSSNGSDEDTKRTGAFYDESITASPNLVYLRILRNNDQFVAGFSPDGIDYAELDTFVNPLPDTITVGICATNGNFEGCGSECDISIPADFDFFQISNFGNGNNTDQPTPVLYSLAIEGPESVPGGSSANFTAWGTYANGETYDITSQCTWTVAPPGIADIDAGLLTALAVGQTKQITLIADAVQEIDGDRILKSAVTLVRIPVNGDAGNINPANMVGPPLCGAQANIILLLGMLGMGFRFLISIFRNH